MTRPVATLTFCRSRLRHAECLVATEWLFIWPESPSFAKFSCHISCSCYCKHIGCRRDTCICRCELFAFCRIMQTFSPKTKTEKKLRNFFSWFFFCTDLLKKCSLLVTYCFGTALFKNLSLILLLVFTKCIVHQMIFKKRSETN